MRCRLDALGSPSISDARRLHAISSSKPIIYLSVARGGPPTKNSHDLQVRAHVPGTTTSAVGGTGTRDAHDRSVEPRPRMDRAIGALLPLFRLVDVRCIAALWRVKSLLRHRSDRPKLEPQSVKVAPDPRYCKMSLRFSSNSALSISPLANRSFKISRAREAVSYTSGSSSRRALGRP
jgi:hypothetical protein